MASEWDESDTAPRRTISISRLYTHLSGIREHAGPLLLPDLTSRLQCFNIGELGGVFLARESRDHEVENRL